MGCTEIPLILRPEDIEIRLLNSTRLLAKAALEEAPRRSIPTHSTGAEVGLWAAR